MRLTALTASLVLFAACKKAPPAPESRPAGVDLAMPATRGAEKGPVPEEIRKLDALIDADIRLAEWNRRMMIIPAPPDFKPAAAARKIELRLVLEKTKLRVGESPRFRLELINVGRDPIDYIEYESSVFRWGGILHSIKTIRFIMTDEKGQSRMLWPVLGGRVEPIKQLSGPLSLAAEAESKASTTFRVKILLGETLRSLGDGDSAAEPYRTMLLRDEFKTAGRKRIHVELDDRPEPLDAGYLELASKYRPIDQIRRNHAERLAVALGPVTSNVVELEVVK